MQRQRGELVPIGEAVSGLDDVSVIRDGSPPTVGYGADAPPARRLDAAHGGPRPRSFR